jgi:hypothetical protein
MYFLVAGIVITALFHHDDVAVWLAIMATGILFFEEED